MSIEERVLRKLDELVAEGAQLERAGNENGQLTDGTKVSACRGWLTSAQHAVQLVCPNPQSAYRTSVDTLVTSAAPFTIQHTVGSVRQVLQRLAADARNGLISSIADTARAEVFDDFLDDAKRYQRNNRKNEAGTVAGVVFEDSVRRLCDKHGIAQKGEDLEQLIVALTKTDVITATKAKRARAAAHVRTKATHAQWDEFDARDVDAAIEFAGEVIGLLDR